MIYIYDYMLTCRKHLRIGVDHLLIKGFKEHLMLAKEFQCFSHEFALREAHLILQLLDKVCRPFIQCDGNSLWQLHFTF